jgi:iron complex transport system permease protein
MDLALPSYDTRTRLILAGLGILLLAVVLLSLTIGAMQIPVREVAIVLLRQLGLFTDADINTAHEAVLITIRFPRVVMTLLIGASLGVSGASLQGLFRNPLVEPSIIGVSGGAAATVVTVIVFGSVLIGSLSFWMQNAVVSVAAFSGGALATFLVLRLGSQSGKINITVLVLMGVAINALTGAFIGLAVFYADEKQLSTFLFWTLGDLGGASWEQLKIAAPLLIVSVVGQLFFPSALNALALGEAEAYHLGVDVERAKRFIILLCAIGVGVSVSLAGIIGFVGLVVPHVIRTSFHPDNTLVLPASVLGGALLLLIADIIARTVVQPAELPIGVVTALVGSPFFMLLLLQAKRKHAL